MAINTRDDFYLQLAQGNGVMTPFRCANNPVAITAGAAASGFHTVSLSLNAATVTEPGTLTSILQPSDLIADTLLSFATHGFGSSGTRAMYLAWFYQLGTLNLTATGNQFTHDVATFPVRRTQFGIQGRPVSLLPLIYITTATTVTPAAFILKDVAPATGYVNQDGASITGTKTFTLPSATTAVNSAYLLRLEDGDSGLWDMTQIDITTAATAGAATIFGVELLCPLGGIAGLLSFTADNLLGGLGLADLRPAQSTAGTLTKYLGILHMGSVTNNIQSIGYFQGPIASPSLSSSSSSSH